MGWAGGVKDGRCTPGISNGEPQRQQKEKTLRPSDHDHSLSFPEHGDWCLETSIEWESGFVRITISCLPISESPVLSQEPFLPLRNTGSDSPVDPVSS